LTVFVVMSRDWPIFPDVASSENRPKSQKTARSALVPFLDLGLQNTLTVAQRRLVGDFDAPFF
jgi:hypothetical protein